jgi:hypothetical protein
MPYQMCSILLSLKADQISLARLLHTWYYVGTHRYLVPTVARTTMRNSLNDNEESVFG